LNYEEISRIDVAGNVSVSLDTPLKPRQAFETFVDELTLGLAARGLHVDRVSRGGKVTEGELKVGIIEECSPKGVSILWHPKPWESASASRISMKFERKEFGTRITVESQNWGDVLGGEPEEQVGWFASEIAAGMLTASAPNRLGDWVTDRHARKPSGARSRENYANPTYHWPNFLAILDALRLGPDDRLVEVGCGGGAFLHEALKSGCRAAAIDHSPDMVRLARRTNRVTISRKRLEVELGDAETLPYPSGSFTCAVMTGVLGFIPDAPRAFEEVFRVLRLGGRFLAYTGSKKMRGSPAAPEPVASRFHFYEDDELEEMARSAGFGEAKVEHPSLFEFAKRSGVPKSDLPLFKGGSGSQLLVCEKL